MNDQVRPNSRVLKEWDDTKVHFHQRDNSWGMGSDFHYDPADVYAFIFNHGLQNKEEALEHAVKLNDIQMAKALICEGATIPYRGISNRQRNALHYACQTGNIVLVKLIYFCFPQALNALSRSSQTPLRYAMRKGHHEIVELLYDLGANIDEIELLQYAARHKRVSFSKKLLIAIPDCSKLSRQGVTVLQTALRFGFKTLAHKLLSLKKGDGSPLFDYGLCRKSKESLLHDAIIGRLYDIASQFLSLRTPEDQPLMNFNQASSISSLSPFLQAVYQGYLPLVKEMIQNRFVDKQAQDRLGNSVLHYAVKTRSLPMLKYLCELKNEQNTLFFDINAKNNDGEMPLFLAVKMNQKDIIAYFISLEKDKSGLGLDLASATIHGETLLHQAASTGNTAFYRWLVSLKSKDGKPLFDYKKKTNLGHTLAHCAVHSHKISILNHVLSLKDSQGNLLIDFNEKDKTDFYPIRGIEHIRGRAFLRRMLFALDKQGFSRVNINNVPSWFNGRRTNDFALLRSVGANEVRKHDELDAILNNANADFQNVHAWEDIACADHNVQALLKIDGVENADKSADNIASKNYHQNFKDFEKYVTDVVGLLHKNQHDDGLSKRYIPTDIRVKIQNITQNIGGSNTVQIKAAHSLEACLHRLRTITMPSEFNQYTYPAIGEKPAETRETILKSFDNMQTLIGLMWKVLHDETFIKRQLPKEASQVDCVQYIKQLEEAFIHNMFFAQYEYNSTEPQACAKGLGSKMIHGLLESLPDNQFTTRSQVLTDQVNAKRSIEGAKCLLPEDFNKLIEPATESLFRKAYFERKKYPERFESLLKYLSSTQYTKLTDKAEQNYESLFGVRHYILGHVKEFLRTHFPLEYSRAPGVLDYIMVEEDYYPRVVYTALQPLLENLLTVNDKSVAAIPFLRHILNCIDKQKLLPELPEDLKGILEDDWSHDYQLQRRSLLEKAGEGVQPDEKNFQFILLFHLTKGVRGKLNAYQTENADSQDAILNTPPPYLNAFPTKRTRVRKQQNRPPVEPQPDTDQNRQAARLE